MTVKDRVSSLAGKFLSMTKEQLEELHNDINVNGTDHEGGIAVDALAIEIVQAAIDRAEVG